MQNFCKFLASYIDYEDGTRKLTGITVVDNINDYDHFMFVEISEEVFNYLQENFPNLSFQKVRIPRGITKIETIDQLINTDLILSDEDRFELEKTSRIVRTEAAIFNHLDLKTVRDFFNFSVRNNQLLAEGVVITDENREEKYLEILRNTKSDDPAVKRKAIKIVDILSEYLMAMDSLTNAFKIFDVIDAYKKEIYDCETIEELDKVTEKYNPKFFG